MRQQLLGAAIALAGGALSLLAQPQVAPPPGSPAPAPPAQGTQSTNLGVDADGNPLRRALKTGHVSNYDEAKVRPYTLPELLQLSDGTPVRDATTWHTRRRPEVMQLYESQIFGRVPAHVPQVKWAVSESVEAGDRPAMKKRVIGTVGTGDRTVRINLDVYTPAKAAGRVPVILLANFGGGTAPASAGRGTTPPPPPPAPEVAAEILGRGWGYATLQYQDIQPDRANSLTEGIIGLTLEPGRTQPGPEAWGAISAWAWGISRAIDYLASDPSVDPKRIALQGHSRLGKAALWASANDERIAATFASCSGEMGAALSRRDWGETVDDMTQNFPWWFAGTFQQWAGRWSEMPVDAHMLIALSAPRGVFVTGGTTDQWADPVGEFLATVAAGPVYRLLGKKDLGVTTLPPLDTPVVTGDLGWHYHTGGHAATPADWSAYLSFLEKYFN
jgi:hypothetical protein